MTILSHYSSFVNTFFYFFLSFFRFGHLCESSRPFSSVFSPFRSIIFADVRLLDTLTDAASASLGIGETLCRNLLRQIPADGGERTISNAEVPLSPHPPHSPWLSATVSHRAFLLKKVDRLPSDGSAGLFDQFFESVVAFFRGGVVYCSLKNLFLGRYSCL